MIRALDIAPAAADAAAEPATDRVTLDREGRYRRRGVLTTDGGETVLLDLAEARELDDGAFLLLEDGRRIAVCAAAEPLYAITAASPQALARLAWHIGNRHLPAAIEPGRLLIARDHVVADMVRRLGGTVAAVVEPFRPEGGAYGHGRTHGHHAHAHAHDDPNARIPARRG
ncbi:MAG: urease accessory protein UreE [Pseudomonadota bacterium]